MNIVILAMKYVICKVLKLKYVRQGDLMLIHSEATIMSHLIQVLTHFLHPLSS